MCLCVWPLTCIPYLRPQEFERNFLRRWSPEVLEHFAANAMPPVETMATEAAVDTMVAMERCQVHVVTLYGYEVNRVLPIATFIICYKYSYTNNIEVNSYSSSWCLIKNIHTSSSNSSCNKHVEKVVPSLQI